MTVVTPYRLNCPHCGPVYLSTQEYDRQMCCGDREWWCPGCGEQGSSMWDDRHFDEFQCNAAQTAIKRLCKKMTAAALRDRGITLEYVGDLPEGLEPEDAQKYLNELALKIAERLEEDAGGPVRSEH